MRSNVGLWPPQSVRMTLRGKDMKKRARGGFPDITCRNPRCLELAPVSRLKLCATCRWSFRIGLQAGTIVAGLIGLVLGLAGVF